MKKLFLVIGIVLTLIACEAKYYSVLITNESNKEVSYTYNDSSDTLVPSASKTYEVMAYTQPPKNINVVAGALSVKMTQKGDTFTFEKTEPFKLSVVNRLPKEVKIKADNYIDDAGSTELTIGKNAEKTTASIYTANPNFTSLIEDTVIIDWNFNDDTVYVVIR
jgi:hypothetical protein